MKEEIIDYTFSTLNALSVTELSLLLPYSASASLWIATRRQDSRRRFDWLNLLLSTHSLIVNSL